MARSHPTPWKVCESYPLSQWLLHSPDDPHPLAYVRKKADADFIGRSCNAHDELVRCLRAQVEAHRLLCRAAGLDEQAHLDGTARARAVLATLEGE